MKIARIVTVPEAFVHIKSLLRFLRIKNEDVTLISSSGKYEEILLNECSMKVHPIKIEREINLLSDLLSLFKLSLFFTTQRFDIVHSSTPKAGLVTALAGWIAHIPVRIHTFTGQRWATMTGFKRELLKQLDRLIIKLNTKCFADSPSQIEYLIAERVAKPGEVLCLHKGSYGGIDISKFNKDNYLHAREELLKEIGVPEDSFIILFVGRVTKEKGIEELVRAVSAIVSKNNAVKLVLVGPTEGGLANDVEIEIKNNPNIYRLGFRTNPAKYFSAADIFCLPSYREGFGTVVLEAAACGVASIGTKIPGLVDAIVDGETGVLVELKNVEKLKEALVSLFLDRARLAKLSENARTRARRDFDSEFLADLQWQEYRSILKKQN